MLPTRLRSFCGGSTLPLAVLVCALGFAACERSIHPPSSERGRALPTRAPIAPDATAAEAPPVTDAPAAEEPTASDAPAAEEPTASDAPAAEEPAASDRPADLAQPSDAGASLTTGIGNATIASFAAAKRQLAGIYADHRITLYCGCRFDDKLRLAPTGCGYAPRNDGARARRIEWEHVVPAEAFGRSFAEWREGHPDCVDRKGKSFRGRDCARKMSREFRLIEADLYNLHPAIGELNGLRENFAMAEIEGEAREYGSCDVEIADRKFEPRAEVKGDVARTYLYMDRAYPGRGIVSGKNRKLFDAWSSMDPVDDWECERARRIAVAQKSDNPVLEAACAGRH